MARKLLHVASGRWLKSIPWRPPIRHFSWRIFMTLEQLITFIHLCKTKNFTKTAEMLHLTQPSVTSRIKNLEEELGVPLFERNGKILTTTSSGEELAFYAQKIVDLMHEAQVNIGKKVREVTIGATPTLSIHLVPTVIADLHHAFPDYRIAIKSGSSVQLMELLIQGKIDVGIVLHRLSHPEIEIFPIKESLSVILVVSPNHPLSSRPRIDIIALKDYQMVRYDPKGGFWELISNSLQQYQMTPDSYIQVDSIEVAKKVLQNTQSTAFMPLPNVQAELSQSLLKRIDVQDVTPIVYPIYMAYRREQHQTDLIQYLSAYFR